MFSSKYLISGLYGRKYSGGGTTESPKIYFPLQPTAYIPVDGDKTRNTAWLDSLKDAIWDDNKYWNDVVLVQSAGGGVNKYPSPDWIDKNPTEGTSNKNLLLNTDWRKPVSRRGIYNLYNNNVNRFKRFLDMWEAPKVVYSSDDKYNGIYFYHEDENDSFYYQQTNDNLYISQTLTKRNIQHIGASNDLTFSVCYFLDGEYKYSVYTSDTSNYQNDIETSSPIKIDKDLWFKIGISNNKFQFSSNAKVVSIKLEQGIKSTLSIDMSIPANPKEVANITGQFITSTLNEDLHLNINNSNFEWTQEPKNYKIFEGLQAKYSTTWYPCISFPSLMTGISTNNLEAEYYGYGSKFSGDKNFIWYVSDKVDGNFRQAGINDAQFFFMDKYVPTDYKLYLTSGINLANFSYYSQGYFIGFCGNIIETREKYAFNLNVPAPI